MTYKCDKCNSENVAQEMTQLWHLNNEDYVSNTEEGNDFFWCFDCDTDVSVEDKE